MIELGLCTLFAIDFLVRLSSSVNPARKFFRLSTIVELMVRPQQVTEELFVR